MKRDLVGNTVGDYELVEFLGEGTSASVYKAYQSGLDRWVALKILHSSDPQLFARFERT